MTSNKIDVVAFAVGFKCPRKIHLNTQCRSGLILLGLKIYSIKSFSVSGKKSHPQGSPSKMQPRYRQQQQQPLEIHSTSPEETVNSGPVPSYMRSTSASAKKERPVSAASIVTFNTPPRRKPSFGHTQSQLDLRTAASDEDSSSEENLQRSKNRRRSSSHDRR